MFDPIPVFDKTRNAKTTINILLFNIPFWVSLTFTNHISP
mgnify:CR=1 FL=1